MLAYANLIVYFLLMLGTLLSITTKKLTIAGGLTGGLIGVILFLGAGLFGLVMLAAFFFLGTAATSWKKSEKQKLKQEQDTLQRKAGQVVANAGVPALMGLLLLIYPEKSSLFLVMLAAGFASAASDTLSSELGMVYGKNCYNILTGRRDIKGLDGVISLEGTLFGVAGSMLIALIYAISFGWNINVFLICLSGVAGNLFDSILGASFERKKYLNNDAVNFLNTLFAAVIALGLVYSI